MRYFYGKGILLILMMIVLCSGTNTQAAGKDEDILGISEEVMIAARTQSNYGAMVIETELGNLAADALLEYGGGDVAIISGGHFDWNLDGGPVTLSDIKKIFPEQYELGKIEISPAMLWTILELAVSHTIIGEAECILPDESEFVAFPQISGFYFTYDASQRPGTRIRDITLVGESTISLEPKDTSSRITLIAPISLLTQELGIHVPELMETAVIPIGTEEQALCAYIRTHQKVDSPGLGRITTLGVYDNTLVNQIELGLLLPGLIILFLVIRLPRNKYRMRNMDGAYSKRYIRFPHET